MPLGTATTVWKCFNTRLHQHNFKSTSLPATFFYFFYPSTLLLKHGATNLFCISSSAFSFLKKWTLLKSLALALAHRNHSLCLPLMNRNVGCYWCPLSAMKGWPVSISKMIVYDTFTYCLVFSLSLMFCIVIILPPTFVPSSSCIVYICAWPQPILAEPVSHLV